VRLEPLLAAHAQDLAEEVELDVFRLFLGNVPEAATRQAMEEYAARFLATPNNLAFAVVDARTGRAIGSTSYLDIKPDFRFLEIGSTWYGPSHRGTAVNPESKLLLLQHAFEGLGCVRVLLKTDGRNLRSQRAIAKLGAKHEGVLRKFGIMRDGHIRDTVMFSILDDEWPAVKAGLIERLRAYDVSDPNATAEAGDPNL